MVFFEFGVDGLEEGFYEGKFLGGINDGVFVFDVVDCWG